MSHVRLVPLPVDDPPARCVPRVSYVRAVVVDDVDMGGLLTYMDTHLSPACPLFFFRPSTLTSPCIIAHPTTTTFSPTPSSSHQSRTHHPIHIPSPLLLHLHKHSNHHKAYHPLNRSPLLLRYGTLASNLDVSSSSSSSSCSPPSIPASAPPILTFPPSLRALRTSCICTSRRNCAARSTSAARRASRSEWMARFAK